MTASFGFGEVKTVSVTGLGAAEASVAAGWAADSAGGASVAWAALAQAERIMEATMRMDRIANIFFIVLFSPQDWIRSEKVDE